MKIHERQPQETAAIQPLSEFDDAQLTFSSGLQASEKIDLDDWATEDLTAERLYASQIKQYPLLQGREEEVFLAKRIESGLYAARKLEKARDTSPSLSSRLRYDLNVIRSEGEQAKEKMIVSNLRLALPYARQRRRGMPFLDAVQHCNFGIMTAVERFDYRRGMKFSTYAMWWIRAALQEGIAQENYNIPMSKHEVALGDKAIHASNALFTKLGREPTFEEVAEETGLKADQIGELRLLMRPSASLDAPAFGSSDGDPVTVSYMDLLPDGAPRIDDFTPSDGEITEDVLRVMSDPATFTDEKHRQVIALRWGLEDGCVRAIADVVKLLKIRKASVLRYNRQASAEIVRALNARGYNLDPAVMLTPGRVAPVEKPEKNS